MNIPSLRPSPDALLNPCADPIFKILFTDESNEAHQALTCFLTDIIGKKVTNVVLQPNELSGESITDKQSEFDINCRIEGKIVNIEIQGLNKNDHFGKRSEYHVAHLLNHYTTKGMQWENALQSFQISVLNFIFDEDEENCVNHYCMRNSNGRTIANLLNVIFMELPKIELISDDISLLTPAQMWGKFFLYASNPEKRDYITKLAEVNRGINMAVTVLKNISQDEMNWYHETRYWMHVSDMKQMKLDAERHGRAEGRKEACVESAKTLLKMKVLSNEQIAQAVGLSLEEVQKLSEQF